MRISELLKTIQAQAILRRSPCGMPLTDKAINVVEATIQDESNYEKDAKICLNCCIILSSLLVPSGCPCCGSKDMSTSISEVYIKE